MALRFAGGSSPVVHHRLVDSLPSGAVFARASTGYQVEPAGDLSVLLANSPRLNAQGVLIERPWTNLNANPEAVGAWVEQQGAGDALVDADAAAAPNGAMTADRVNFLAGSSDRGRSDQQVGLVNGNQYTTAAYVKAAVAPSDFRVKNPNSAAGIVNGVATAAWQRVRRDDTVVGTVSGYYLRRDSGDGGSLLVWGGVRYARDFGILYEYHPTGLAAERLSLPNAGIDARQGTLGITWVPLFAAADAVGGASEQVIRQIVGTDFRLAWAANDTPGYVRLYNNGGVVAQLHARHAAGDVLRLRVHYGGRPTRPHLECNGWAMKATAAWVAPTIGTTGYVGSTGVPSLHCPGRYRDSFVTATRYMHRHRFASLGDSISYEPYGSGNESWNRPFGLLAEAADGYVLVAGVLNDTLALMGARVVADVVDQDVETCVVLGGINDIVTNRTLVQMQADALAVYAALAAAGVRVVACTVLPWKGAASWSAAREAIRVAFNAWVLSRPTGVDLAVDTASALADPLDAEQLLAAHDSGDHVHPSDAGGTAIANAVWAVA